jgi:hypothetical protein
MLVRAVFAPIVSQSSDSLISMVSLISIEEQELIDRIKITAYMKRAIFIFSKKFIKPTTYYII